jgi:hypothetical protein
MYLSPLLVLFVLLGRLAMAVLHGAVDLITLPVRTALAVAPHLRRPQWVLVTGTVLTVLLTASAVALMLGAVR